MSFLAMQACFSVTVFGVLFLAAAWLIYKHATGQMPIWFAGRRYANLDDFVARFGRSVGLVGRTTDRWSMPSSARFDGRREGRAVALTFASRGKAGTQTTFLVAAQGAPVVRIGLRGFIDWLRGTPALGGGWFVLKAGDARAQAAVEAAQFEIAHALRRFRFEQIAIGESALIADANGFRFRSPEDYAEAIDALVRVLDRLEAAHWTTLAGPVRVRARTAWRIVRSPSSRVRCGFCHEELAEADLPVASCERCGTVLHAECWQENGEHCPVLGCPATRERAA